MNEAFREGCARASIYDAAPGGGVHRRTYLCCLFAAVISLLAACSNQVQESGTGNASAFGTEKSTDVVSGLPADRANARHTKEAITPANAADKIPIYLQLTRANRESEARDQLQKLRDRLGEIVPPEKLILTSSPSVTGQNRSAVTAGPYYSKTTADRLCERLKARGFICVVTDR